MYVLLLLSVAVFVSWVHLVCLVSHNTWEEAVVYVLLLLSVVVFCFVGSFRLSSLGCPVSHNTWEEADVYLFFCCFLVLFSVLWVHLGSSVSHNPPFFFFFFCWIKSILNVYILMLCLLVVDHT